MASPPLLTAAIPFLVFLLVLFLASPASSSHISSIYITSTASKTTLQGEYKPYINMTYHNGTILSSNITVHLIWYGQWSKQNKSIIRDFIRSISAKNNKSVEPSVASWWNIVRLYDNKHGVKVTENVCLGNEADDENYSHGKLFTPTTLEQLILLKIVTKALPVTTGSVYLLLTSENVTTNEFCRAKCAIHGHLIMEPKKKPLPYAWIGNSATQCPGMCAYPFAKLNFPGAPNTTILKPPNGDVGVDGMVINVAHELAGMATNPFGNGWYAGNKDVPNEVAGLCQGIYGTGAGGSYPGKLLTDKKTKASFNVYGANGRKFLVSWLYDRFLKKCNGPNALKS